MALYKEIRQEDGVVTKYHRILFLTKTINRQNSIAVLSYVDEESRGSELSNGIKQYRKSITYETSYNENMTINDAYKYLKTLHQFKDATDS